jgi:hypothetical protein
MWWRPFAVPMGEPEIRPLVDPKRLNRSKQNFVRLIKSLRSRNVPILVAIGYTVAPRHMREIWPSRAFICIFIFNLSVSQTHAQPGRDVVERRIMAQTMWFHARMCLWGVSSSCRLSRGSKLPKTPHFGVENMDFQLKHFPSLISNKVTNHNA